MLQRLTLKSVNAFLARRGINERLAKGPGHFFFTGGDAVNWTKNTVFATTLNSRTIEGWLIEYYGLKQNRRPTLFPYYEKYMKDVNESGKGN